MNAVRRREYAEECLAELWQEMEFPAGQEMPALFMRLNDWREDCRRNGCAGSPLWWIAPHIAGLCIRCNSIWLWSGRRAKPEIRKSVRHELLHLRHPEWSEILVQAANGERKDSNGQKGIPGGHG